MESLPYRQQVRENHPLVSSFLHSPPDSWRQRCCCLYTSSLMSVSWVLHGHFWLNCCICEVTKPLDVQPAYLVPVPSQDWEGCNARASGIKMGDDGGGSLISPDRVARSRVVCASASVIFPCTIKPRWRMFLLVLAHPGSPGQRAVKRL